MRESRGGFSNFNKKEHSRIGNVKHNNLFDYLTGDVYRHVHR